ncbi:predicted protein [Histoplasma capsulatum var. duboisii H88]|nr:predicted protein [Histoplasma capsulatum var. duboisii H88]
MLARLIIVSAPLSRACLPKRHDNIHRVFSRSGRIRYLFKDGKTLSIDLSSIPLLEDTTRVEGERVTHEKRYTKSNTILIKDSDFPNVPRIDYHAMRHGT